RNVRRVFGVARHHLLLLNRFTHPSEQHCHLLVAECYIIDTYRTKAKKLSHHTDVCSRARAGGWARSATPTQLEEAVSIRSD
ncbi:hypothetical protein GBAR_LOCUS19835, partial [Geodia barretti]